MEPIAQKIDFVWRRLLDAPPTWGLAAPVAFVFGVLLLLTLFRPSGTRARMWIPTLVVAALSAVYVIAGLRLLLGLAGWLYLLAPTLAIALVYVGLMYRKDARSVHPAIAGFLGLLRCLTYLVLAAVFLLPGCQTFDRNEYRSKVLFLFDVSGSMVATVDDLPEVGQDPATLPTRQDKVIRLLTQERGDAGSFLSRVLAKSPVTAYRFGSTLDETEVGQWKADEAPSVDLLQAWMKPSKARFVEPTTGTEADKLKARARHDEVVDSLLSGTNLGGAALQMAKLESNSYVQMVCVVSDGQSNLGSEEAIRDFVSRFTSGKKVPIATVGVGEFRLPASIRIDDLQAPETARPDDKFPVRVPVVGVGLADEEFAVTLEVQRVKDGVGQPVNDQKFTLGPKKGKFQGAGDYPQDTVEFDIDVQELKGIKAGDDADGALEGTWRFVAKTPRHPRESFPKAEHVSEPPTEVVVQKRKLRVLLFAGGPTREYQFVRTILYREVSEKRMEMSVLLQTGREDHVDQDVEADRLLNSFPNRIGASDAGEKYLSLSDYDAIVAIDPDWMALEPAQMKLLKEWVGAHSGGILFVAGPVNTYQLARPAGVDISALKTLLPVHLNDSRLHGLGGIGHDASRPYVLNFTPAARNFDFLKLDEEAESPTAGWERFFWGPDGPPADKNEKPRNGFYNYYPVDKLKGDSAVLATFAGPQSSRINDGKDEQPFLVSMRYGSGKTMYLGSGETWRLRRTKDAFHERFWIKMARYLAAGTTQQKRYGRMLVSRTVSVGNVAFEAQLKGADLLPLPMDVRPTVIVKRLDAPEGAPKKDESIDLKAKQTQGDWAGWFAGTFKARDPGEYELRIPIAGTNEALTQRITVRKPNPELDNVRNNFGLLYQVATEAAPVLAPLPADVGKKVERTLAPSEDASKGSAPRLFFRLDQADALADCLRTVEPRVESVKGKLYDLWDDGWKTGYVSTAFTMAWSVPLVVGAFGFVVLLVFRQFLFAGLFLGAGVLMSAGVFAFDLIAKPNWPELPLNLSYVLVALALLLGLEWLLRKLLKLA